MTIHVRDDHHITVEDAAGHPRAIFSDGDEGPVGLFYHTDGTVAGGLRFCVEDNLLMLTLTLPDGTPRGAVALVDGKMVVTWTDDTGEPVYLPLDGQVAIGLKRDLIPSTN